MSSDSATGQVWAVVAGGGTSGHVHPALAIAEELVGRGRSKDEIHFIGSSRGLEAELVPEHGYKLTALPGRGIERAINLQNVKSAAQLGVAGVRALATLRRLKPAVVISVGGYASLPAMAAAAVLKIPIIVTEQNSVPGAANRFGSRWAKACATAFPSTDLPNAVHTGNPLLGPILEVSDLVVCRAGATSVAEIAETGTPSVLVPLPYAPGDHQTLNARALSDHGGAILMKDADVTGASLVEIVQQLLDTPGDLAELSTKAKALARPDAASAIADLVEMHARER